MSKRKETWIHMLLRETFTAKEIADEIGISLVQCHTTIRVFIKRGIVKRLRGVGVAGNPRKLTVVLGQEPQFGSGGSIARIYRKTGRQQLWNNIKIARKFTVESLLSSINVSLTAAQQYIKALRDAGYIQLLKEGKKQKGTYNGKNVYHLIRDTGRLAPRLCKGGMEDQNEQKFYPFQQQSRQQVNEEAHHDVAR